jgi:hypothetical protein
MSEGLSEEASVPTAAGKRRSGRLINMGAAKPYELAKEPIMRSPELEKILEDHALWYRTGGAEGIRLDLSGAKLSEADLSGADLFGADMTYVDMRCVALSGAMLPWSVLRIDD